LRNVEFIDAETKVREMTRPALLQDQAQSAMAAELELRSIGDPGATISEVRNAVSQEDSVNHAALGAGLGLPVGCRIH